MNLGILSREPTNYSTSRLVAAARSRGHSAQVLDTMKFNILVEHGRPSLTYENRPCPEIDAIIPRIGASVTPLRPSPLRLSPLRLSPRGLSPQDKPTPRHLVSRSQTQKSGAMLRRRLRTARER